MGRLIVADELIEIITGNDELIDWQKDKFVDCVNACDTAYDVDAVVEQLKKVEEHCLDMHDWQGQSAIEKAIEIVKGGCVDAKTDS